MTVTSLQIVMLCFCWGCLLYPVESLPQDCTLPIDLVFVVDSSESVIENDPPDQQLYTWNATRLFLSKIMDSLQISQQVRLGAVQFSNRTEKLFSLRGQDDFEQSKSQLLNMMHMGGNTNTGDVLNSLYDEYFWADSANVREIVVMLTDGMSNIDPHLTRDAAMDVKAKGIEVYTIAIGKEIDIGELYNIASSPFSKYFIQADGVDDLDDIADEVVNKLCVPPSVEKPEPECTSSTSDIAIVIDSSGSIRDKNPVDGSYDNFEFIKGFINSFLDMFKVSESDNRIAVVFYSDTAKVRFHLNDYYDVNEVKAEVNDVPYIGGHTNTSGALRLLRTEIFTPEKGDRADVPNVVVIITDGESTVDTNLTLVEAERLKHDGTHLFVVGVTHLIDEVELIGIASDPDNEHYFNSFEVRYLENLLYYLVKYVCDAM